jgi:hypothetical protein
MIKAEGGGRNHRDREPENCRVRDSHKTRARDPLSPRLNNCHLLLKDKGETMKDESGKQVARSRLPVF